MAKSSKQESQELEVLLKKGRTRYENALFEIEQVWGKLQKHDYAKRQKLIKAALGMLSIDQKLKAWESKLRSE
jgi:hypothetical protein